jgi:UDP-N-acetylglucosamine 2-epimerase (non-hydrolysing)/GDP/UDP-N,N'-diacetylbacillosamine 2-epimerase (hydrolysing)
VEDKTVKICVCTASRSERQLIKPLLEELEANPKFKLHVLELPTNFLGGFKTAKKYLETHGKPDLAFCSFDRVEMLGACLAFFLDNVKIAQYHAGDTSGEGETFDDYVRFMITLCSDYQFCNGENAYKRCLQFLKLVGKPTEHCFEVGSLAFDNVSLDYSIVPNQPYDFILYNPLTRQPNLMENELNQIERLIGKRLALWIYPNEDEGREHVIEKIKKLEAEGKVKAYQTLPRPQFLALMEKADRIIGNSSSFFLELPFFGKKHVHVGARNKHRERIQIRTGASKRIVKILEETT